ncbi:hypothetical protein OUZ56_033133 [Daphnia magna]|uniref:Uncharacterized protein n=1 Tax=Daphnia magna TaxID=35525 RepID=A0ABR0BAA4_9CRUS|nr:hypothetical protein OUZ56_033133 [Daphnia magna]
MAASSPFAPPSIAELPASAGGFGAPPTSPPHPATASASNSGTAWRRGDIARQATRPGGRCQRDPLGFWATLRSGGGALFRGRGGRSRPRRRKGCRPRLLKGGEEVLALAAERRHFFWSDERHQPAAVGVGAVDPAERGEGGAPDHRNSDREQCPFKQARGDAGEDDRPQRENKQADAQLVARNQTRKRIGDQIENGRNKREGGEEKMPQPPEEVDGGARGTATDVSIAHMEGVESLAIGGNGRAEAVGPRTIKSRKRIASGGNLLCERHQRPQGDLGRRMRIGIELGNL